MTQFFQPDLSENIDSPPASQPRFQATTAERQQLVAAHRLVDVRNKLVETIKQVDAMMLEDKLRE
jgi:hypothetical protein